MRCPECNSTDTTTYNTVSTNTTAEYSMSKFVRVTGGTSRNKKCNACANRWVTYEMTKAQYEELEHKKELLETLTNTLAAALKDTKPNAV